MIQITASCSFLVILIEMKSNPCYMNYSMCEDVLASTPEITSVIHTPYP
jgi:hypothetical protein